MINHKILRLKALFPIFRQVDCVSLKNLAEIRSQQGEAPVIYTVI